MMFFSSLIFLSLTVLGLASQLKLHDKSFSPDHVLRVSNIEAALACHYRYTAVVNGTTPGPVIRLQEGRTSWIRVYNDFETDNLTVHWHGLSEATAPFSDGSPLAAQWPIPPGHFFDYEIKPAIGEAGSYFYHSHVNFQTISAIGPLIVEEAEGCKPPYHYAEERMFFLSELYNKTDAEIVAGLRKSLANFTWSGETEQLLVNGKGYPAHSNNFTQTKPPYSDPPNSTAPTCSPEIFRVRPSTTYRFRNIGAVGLSLVSYMFEDHDNLTIIAADGRYTKPAEATGGRIQIDSGQRFDYLLTTKSEEELRKLNKTNFWIQLESRYRPVNVTSYAILSYEDCEIPTQSIPSSPPAETPLTISNDIQDWLEYTLEPIKPNNFPTLDQVSRTVILASAQRQFVNTIEWTINNRSWTEVDEHLGDTSVNDTSPNTGTPYLVSIYKNGNAAVPDFSQIRDNNGYDPQRNVFAAEVGEIIDIVLENQPNNMSGGFDIHSWHIHGGHIYDLGSGPGAYDAVENEKRFKNYNPVMRDSTMLYKYTTTDGVGTLPAYTSQGWRAWRLRVDDAGVWMVHCHTLQHMIMGMQTVWVMGNATQIKAGDEPYVAGYLDYGGSAYGNSSYDPLVMHHF